MSEEVLVKVENVSKKFCKDLKTSLWYGAKDLSYEFLGFNRKATLREKEFWAVKDVSFELKRGECLGLIGHNGAGKSTLLKILNGLIKPDKGKITLKGRIGALIELGAGFNPVLTGRENIYINGQVLGLTKHEINQKFDEIVEFAEIKEFIDTPVRNYSSGMKVRLGFAVAAQMEPDVLIIDEVLAVGDVGFRSKCYDAISKMSGKSSVIFVSHNMPMVARVCSSALLLERGKRSYEGIPAQAIEKYYDFFRGDSFKKLLFSDNIEIEEFESNKGWKVETGKAIILSLKIIAKEYFDNLELNIVFLSRELVPVMQFSSNFQLYKIAFKKGENHLRVEILSLDLNPGIYNISVTIDHTLERKKILWYQGFREIKVVGGFFGNAPYVVQPKWEIYN